MEGTVTYYGFANEDAKEPEVKVVINAGQFATSPPQYWHRVELSDDAQFNINFWVEDDNHGDEMYQAKSLKPLRLLIDGRLSPPMKVCSK